MVEIIINVYPVKGNPITIEHCSLIRETVDRLWSGKSSDCIKHLLKNIINGMQCS